MSYFTKIKYNNYSNYSGINNSVRFKSINTIKISILSFKGKAINLILTNIKYYLVISPFNLIFIS